MPYCPIFKGDLDPEPCNARQATKERRAECLAAGCPRLAPVVKPARAKKPKGAKPSPLELDGCPKCGAAAPEFIGTDPPERRPGQAIYNVFRCTECGEERRELREGKHHRWAKPRKGWGLSMRQVPPENDGLVEAALEAAGKHLPLTDEARKELDLHLRIALSAEYWANDRPRPKEVRGCLGRLRDLACRVQARPQDTRLRLRFAEMLGEVDVETRRVLEAGNVFSTTTGARLPGRLSLDGMAALLALARALPNQCPAPSVQEVSDWASIVATACERALNLLPTASAGAPRGEAQRLLVEVLVKTYATLTGRRPGFSRHPETHAPGGPLFRFVADVLTALNRPPFSPESLAYLLRDLTEPAPHF